MPRSRDRAGRSLRSLLLAVSLLLGMASTAHAHARLKASSPAAGAVLHVVPAQLRLDFTESPDLSLTRVEVHGPDGRLVVASLLRYAADSHRSVVADLSGALGAGAYVVVWQAVGDDGHPVQGRFGFSVAPGAVRAPGSPDASTSPGGESPRRPVAMSGTSPMSAGAFNVESFAFVVVRWVEYLALLLAIGAATFRLFVLRAFVRDDAPQFCDMRRDAEQRAANIGMIASGTLVIDAACRFCAQWFALRATGSVGPAFFSMMAHSRWGWSWIAQVTVAFLMVLAYRSAAVRRQDAAWRGLTGLGLLLACTPSLTSHAASVDRMGWLPMLADGSHVLGASAWIGSLSLILLAGFPAILGLPEKDRGPATVRMVAAFSPIALGGASLVAATGALAAWLQIGSWSAVYHSGYGQTLLVKLSLVALMALAGAFNWRVVTPKLPDEGTVALRTSVRIELGLATLVLLVTAVLVALPTPMDAMR